jgi:hypothetical protein
MASTAASGPDDGRDATMMRSASPGGRSHNRSSTANRVAMVSCAPDSNGNDATPAMRTVTGGGRGPEIARISSVASAAFGALQAVA